MPVSLGPVVGKVGGGEKPIDFVPATATPTYTITLPDGEWGIAINFGTNNGSSTSATTLTVNGVEAAEIRGSSAYRNAPVSVVLRHRTGQQQMVSSRSDMPIRSVTAFPDPA